MVTKTEPLHNATVNTSCLDELKELLEEDFPVFLTLYLESTDELLLSISNNNIAEINHLAHQLKSTTQQIGAYRLYGFLQEMERYDQMLSLELCEEISSEVGIVQDYLQKILAHG